MSNPADPSTFEFPPGSGRWYKPGPVMEARWLGRWPSAGTYGVWSEALWDAAVAANLKDPSAYSGMLPRIGCDVARFGDDWTALHLRWGSVSLGHDSYNGRDTMETVGRLVRMASEAAALAYFPGREPPTAQQIVLAVDDDGVGGGVTDRLREMKYNVRPVRAGSVATNPADYPNLRSELWFAVADRAKRRLLDLSRLPSDIRQRLRAQAMAPEWKLDSAGRRVVEPKDVTKKKVKRSPDDMDALNLAYYECPDWVAAAGRSEPTRPDVRQRPGAEREQMGRGEMGGHRNRRGG